MSHLLFFSWFHVTSLNQETTKLRIDNKDDWRSSRWAPTSTDAPVTPASLSWTESLIESSVFSCPPPSSRVQRTSCPSLLTPQTLWSFVIVLHCREPLSTRVGRDVFVRVSVFEIQFTWLWLMCIGGGRWGGGEGVYFDVGFYAVLCYSNINM